MVFVLTSVDSLLTNTSIERTPRVGPYLSLLRGYETDISLGLDGRLVPVPNVSVLKKVNCTIKVFSFCDLMTKLNLSAIHLIILVACFMQEASHDVVMNIYTDFKNCF